MEERKLRILFVCTVNRMRSATAHELYKNDERFEINSAGTDASAKTVINQQLLDWGDAIVVMEKAHRNFIRKQYPNAYSTKKIVCLYIPDEYEYMQKELVDAISVKFEDVYTRGLLN